MPDTPADEADVLELRCRRCGVTYAAGPEGTEPALRAVAPCSPGQLGVCDLQGEHRDRPSGSRAPARQGG